MLQYSFHGCRSRNTFHDINITPNPASFFPVSDLRCDSQIGTSFWDHRRSGVVFSKSPWAELRYFGCLIPSQGHEFIVDLSIFHLKNHVRTTLKDKTSDKSLVSWAEKRDHQISPCHLSSWPERVSMVEVNASPLVLVDKSFTQMKHAGKHDNQSQAHCKWNQAILGCNTWTQKMFFCFW